MPIPLWGGKRGPVALDGYEALNVLAAGPPAACAWCAIPGSGRVGIPARPVPGMPRLQAAGRFIAPAAMLPALLPEAVPQERLAELAVGELARGGRWVKVIADFPPVTDGMVGAPA